jgi:hypothetical protein
LTSQAAYTVRRVPAMLLAEQNATAACISRPSLHSNQATADAMQPLQRRLKATANEQHHTFIQLNASGFQSRYCHSLKHHMHKA